MIGEWIRAILSRIRGKPANLVELFEDYQVDMYVEHTSVGKGGKVYGKRITHYRIVPRENPKKVTLKDLEEYVKNLDSHHPEEGFCLETTKIGGKKYYVITKKNQTSKNPTVPIYFDLSNQRFFIEKNSLKNPLATNYIVMITLGSLGVTQSKYVSSRLIKDECN